MWPASTCQYPAHRGAETLRSITSRCVAAALHALHGRQSGCAAEASATPEECSQCIARPVHTHAWHRQPPAHGTRVSTPGPRAAAALADPARAAHRRPVRGRTGCRQGRLHPSRAQRAQRTGAQVGEEQVAGQVGGQLGVLARDRQVLQHDVAARRAPDHHLRGAGGAVITLRTGLGSPSSQERRRRSLLS